MPALDGKMRFWRNTNIATLGKNQFATLGHNTLGYEWDEDFDNGARPPGLIRLSTTTVNASEKLSDQGSTYKPAQATHHLTMYRHVNGPHSALVFGAGTVQWSWGLADLHDRGNAPSDLRMQQATLNLLADMGIQPGSIQMYLSQGIPSTDTIAPISNITSPLEGNTMWQLEDGNSSVVVGIIDSGVDYNHLDLATNMWRNVLEIPGNGLDDDQNGYIDDVYGINALLNNGNPFDDNSHGTHVAGTIGADGNNSRGIVGVAQDIQMIACKFLSASGSGATSDAIQCLQYFANLKTRAQNPVNIVATNNSWGSSGSSTALRDAIAAHQNLGILFVAAAGNAAQNNDISGSFPANYELSNVISVAATDSRDRLGTFSNYGRRSVHVGAPGVSILSTVPNQGYASYSGTSMATPHVTGLVAILKSRLPSHDYKKIKNLLLAGGTPLAALSTTTITGRRIRGADTLGRGSLTCTNQNIAARLRPIANSLNLSLGSSVFLSALKINCDLPAGPLVLFSDANESVILQDNGLHGDLVANDGVYSLLWRPLRAGSYQLNYGAGDNVSVTVNGTTPLPRYTPIPQTFNYETIVGSSLGVTDESVHALNLPFAIRFNNNATGYTRVYLTANGTISFTTTTNPGYNNAPLPTSAASTLIAPYWDDLIPSGTNSNVYVALGGSTPNRRLIIEWRNLRHYNSSGLGTFQAILYENSSDIRFNYLDTNFSNTSYDSGSSATVGVQTTTSSASQYSYNAAVIASQSSLLFRLQ